MAYQPDFAWTRHLPGFARTIAVAAAGAAIAVVVDLPSPWLSGPMIATAIAAVRGWSVTMPTLLRAASQVVIGIALGAGIGPETLALLPTWPVTLILLTVCTVAVTGVGTVFFQRAYGWDRATAFYASLPGAFPMVLAMSAASKADLRLVVIAQSMRMFLLLAVLPILIVVIGGGAPRALRPIEGGPLDFLMLIALALAVGWLLTRLKVPAEIFFGAMAASIVLHATGISHAMPPPGLTILAFAVQGTMAGERFSGTDMKTMRRAGVAAIWGFVVSLVVTSAFVGAAALAMDIPMQQLILGFAPGGMDSMASLALMMHLDSPFVVAHQFGRFLFLAVTMPILAKAAKL